MLVYVREVDFREDNKEKSRMCFYDGTFRAERITIWIRFIKL